MGIGPFRSGSVLEQRERAAGFNGVGGSFLSNPLTSSGQDQVVMIQRPSEAPVDSRSQIATGQSQSRNR